MINIQKSQIVFYESGEKSVTVYFDFDDASKKMYIVPTPHMLYGADNQPIFSLTKYLKNKGGISGMCYFDVELAVPKAALEAVQAAFPDNVLGQFDWVSVQSLFSFDVAGELMELVATPSMYGSNRVTFCIEVTSDEMLQTFINAFNAKDSLISPFHVQYDMTVLTKLTGVSAKVSYDASIAIAYEKQIEYKKDTWGNKSAVTVDIKKNLKQSGAGKVDISWNVAKTPELELMVNDWAWTTLEKMVAQALSTAEKAATESLPLESTASFTQSYQEDQVIEWSVTTNDALPRFNDVVWQAVYHEVDLRQLVVTFNTLGIYTEADGKDIVSMINVTVEYPTVEPQTFVLIPSDNNRNSYIYNAPGDFSTGGFNSEYKFRYEVLYNNLPPFVSEWIVSQETLITLNPSLLGIRNVTFIGSDIPFTGEKTREGSAPSKTINRLIIDFYYTRPEGVPNKVDQKVMTSNGDSGKIQFTSHYNLPLENTYTYRYTYQYNDNTTTIIEATQGFGSQNRDQLMVLFPYQKQEFTLKARRPVKDGISIIEVDVTVEYKDEQNNINESYQYSWAPAYEDNKPIAQSTPWNFFAPTNRETALFELNGSIIDDVDETPVNNLILPATSLSLLLDATKTFYTITIDPQQIDWVAVDNVLVTLLQKQEGQEIDNDLAHYYLASLPAGTFEEKNKRNVAVETSKNILTYSLLQPQKGKSSLQRYYNIQKLSSSPSLIFYISAEYIQNDGTRKYLQEIQVTNKTIVSLPKNGSDSPLTFIPVSLEIS